jgi:hypothetical protein
VDRSSGQTRRLTSIVVCSCPRAALCSTCFAGTFDNLRGVAACRGEVWAMSVARRCKRAQPWPSTDRARALARDKVRDLTADPRLLGQLADEVTRWATRWWASVG